MWKRGIEDNNRQTSLEGRRRTLDLEVDGKVSLYHLRTCDVHRMVSHDHKHGKTHGIKAGTRVLSRHV